MLHESGPAKIRTCDLLDCELTLYRFTCAIQATSKCRPSSANCIYVYSVGNTSAAQCASLGFGFTHRVKYTLSQKNDNDVLRYNFNAHQPILIIFGRDIAE